METVVYAGKLIGQQESFVANDAVVVIKGGKIEEVRNRKDYKPSLDANIVDWSGLSVLPGLIDCHGVDFLPRIHVSGRSGQGHARPARQ